jgi:hypothetical protein
MANQTALQPYINDTLRDVNDKVREIVRQLIKTKDDLKAAQMIS